MCKNCKGTGYDKGVRCACQDNQICPACGKELFIKEYHTRDANGAIQCLTKPTIQDARNEDAVYEWPDGTWCWKYELHEYNWKSDDYTLVWYNPEIHK